MRSKAASHLARAILATAVVVAANAAPPAPPNWLRVDYAALVDGRKLTHSGEPVSVLLARLQGRPTPPPGERPEDALTYRLLDPLLEPYAFVLPDALDAMTPPHELPWVEVGSLWEAGEAQPAWVELVRARRFVLESDGEGRLRACLPATSLDAASGEIAESVDPVKAAKAAWTEAWPVLRHALSGERLRLAQLRGGEAPPLTVEVHAYRHLPAKGVFELGAGAWTTTVTDTRLGGDRPPLDLAPLQSLLARRLTLEGARLSPAGGIRWFTSEGEVTPAILGRPVSLADVAVAYRAVAHGGNGEPYMSLDRAPVPHRAIVNYGGRLRDTALGMVSLLSDVRFKTFSVGVDLIGESDVRDAVRRTLPEFRTHLERFAADPSAGAILNQQTRFWFYPDAVDLTLSAEGDVLAFRRVRMSAASERVREAGAAAADPPWTKSTVAYLNDHYEELAAVFPEMAELDESVRWLAVFTWLQAAKARGLPTPDLDALLAQELPAVPTPRDFPQLLSHNVLPAPGASGIVDVLDRTDVGDALDRLEPAGGSRVAAARRLSRDQAMLSPQIPDQAALAKEIAALPAGSGATERDLLAYRAERLLMHARVLATIPPERRGAIERRREQQPGTRVFSVGIGGVDLGMGSVLARASRSAERLGLQARAAPPSGAPAAAPARPQPAVAAPRQPVAAVPEPQASAWPDHGLGNAADRTITPLGSERGKIEQRARSGSLVRVGSFKRDGGAVVSWDEAVTASEGPEARSRRRIADPGGGGLVIQRWEDGRLLSYRFERAGRAMRATPATVALPDDALRPIPPAAASGGAPAELLLMDLSQPAGVPAVSDTAEPPAVPMRLVTGDGRERAASIPRAVLQRLVRGHEIDVTPERPLPAFTPASGVLGSARTLMVLARPEDTRAPWAGERNPVPGEEDPARLADALTRWWSAEPPPHAAAVVGVDPVASPARWGRAPLLDGGIVVLAPEDAFPGTAAGLRAGLVELGGHIETARLVVVASAESPGVLGRRLRTLASDPAYQGKILAVVSFGGPLRPDLPASLLSEGRLAGLSVATGGPVGKAATAGRVASWIREASGAAAKGRRAEELPGPFTWYY